MTNRSRILCVSLNAAIDRRIRVPRLNAGAVNRAISAEPEAGGKAAHVAFAARALGADVRWMGFLGGPEGDGCREGIQARGVTAVCVTIAGRTRTNLEIIDEASGNITEVLEPGPEITQSELQEFRQQFSAEIRDCSTVVLSGSLPRGVPVSIYADLIQCAKNTGCTVFLDTSGDPLFASLAAGPSLVKPNRAEAEAVLGKAIKTVDDAISGALEMRRSGVGTVVISLGADGAVAIADQVMYAAPPPVSVISAVGSGDSLLAGWAVAALEGRSFEERLRFAVACGAANCIAPGPGLISAETVKRFLPLVKLRSCAS
jgi:1-phosphofructokinase family hexose kinase